MEQGQTTGGEGLGAGTGDRRRGVRSRDMGQEDRG